MRRPGLITRRNLIRAGLAAPFVLPKFAVAASLHAGSGRTFLGGAGNTPTPPGYYNFTGSNLPIYSAAVAATQAGTSNTKVIINGDSTVAGYGSNTAGDPFVALSAPSVLSGLIGFATSNWAYWTSHANGASQLAHDARMVFTGSWQSSSSFNVLGGRPVISGATNDFFTFTPTNQVDTFEIELSGGVTPAGGTIAFSVNGGSVLATQATNVSNTILKVVVTTTLGFNALKGLVTLQNTNGVVMVSVYAYNSAAKEISICNTGIPGAVASAYIDATFWPSVAPALAYFAPKLTIGAYGINDWATSTNLTTFQSEIATFISNQKAAGSDVILYSENPTNPGTGQTLAVQATYVAAIKAAALAAGVPFIDVWGGCFGGAYNPALYDLTLDPTGVHPNATGYANIAAFLYRALVPGFIRNQ